MKGLLRPLPLLTLLALVTALLGARALAGSWIYDDVNMLENSTMDGVEDLGLAFARTSTDYMREKRANDYGLELGGATYRPLSMITLIAAQAFNPPVAWLHHLVSWLLHLLALGGLACLAAGRASAGRLSPWSVALLLVFAIHPVGGEAYLWINGRSDVLAGACLSWLAVWLDRTRPETSARARAFTLSGAFLLAAAGAASKETFVPAALLMALALGLPRRGGEGGRGAPIARAVALHLGPVIVGVVAYLALRAGALAGSGARTSLVDTPLDPRAIARIPRLVGMASESFLLPLAQPMRSLTWELYRPWTVGEAFGLFVCLCVLALLVWRRAYRSLCLLLGAIACLAPTAYVADMLWLGFDRYLYMPMLLLTLAAFDGAPMVDDFLATQARRARAFVALGGLYIALAAASLFVVSGYYVDGHVFAWSMAMERSNDPSGYIFASAVQASGGDDVRAKALLDAAPLEHASSGILLAMLEPYRRLGEHERFEVLAERAYAESPEGAFTRFELLQLRGAQQRFTEAAALAKAMLSDEKVCPVTRRLLEDWVGSGDLAPEAIPSFRRLIAEAPCKKSGSAP